VPPPGTIQGNIFDATQTSCSDPTAAPIGGATVNIGDHVGPVGPGCDTDWSGATAGDGSYSHDMCAGGVSYTVSVTGAPGGFLTDPATYDACGGTTAVVNNPGDVVTVNIGLTTQLDAWMQAEGSGDVYAAGLIDAKIPVTCTGACDPNLVSVGSEDPGLVTYGGTGASFGSGKASTNGWLANTTYDGKQYGYSLFFNQLGLTGNSASDFSGLVSKPSAPPLSGTAYFSEGSMLIDDTSWQNISEKIVVLVNGDLDIKNQVTVNAGGFLAFLVKGDIRIDPLVDNVEGVYIADGFFETGTTGAGDLQLIAEGTFVGWGGVNLARDFDSVQNNTEPAELFRYRPDFKVNLPGFLKRPTINWEEVAP